MNLSDKLSNSSTATKIRRQWVTQEHSKRNEKRGKRKRKKERERNCNWNEMKCAHHTITNPKYNFACHVSFLLFISHYDSLLLPLYFAHFCITRSRSHSCAGNSTLYVRCMILCLCMCVCAIVACVCVCVGVYLHAYVFGSLSLIFAMISTYIELHFWHIVLPIHTLQLQLTMRNSNTRIIKHAHIFNESNKTRNVKHTKHSPNQISWIAYTLDEKEEMKWCRE